jgi:hypothetical protein
MRSRLMSLIISADVPFSIDDIWIPLALQVINAKH